MINYLIMYAYILFFIINTLPNLEAVSLVRKTNNGFVSGRSFILPENNKSVNAWLGIPYAEKPINDLRFKRPLPVSNWTDVLQTISEPFSCYQKGNLSSSEDCLYLNIWTPSGNIANLPVLIWIHGGGFQTGSSTSKNDDPKMFVAETNIIYVTVEYRLSIFGFLFMDHEDAPGNQGLLDQALSIKWIYENIVYFGGDKSRITLSGQSAGAKSVGFHLLSNISSKYYRNAILTSGSSLADVDFTEKCTAIEQNTNIIKSFDCSGSTLELIECAKKINPSVMLQKVSEYMNNQSDKIYSVPTFSPVVDNYFLEDEPINLFKQGKFKNCSILTGSNRDEGNFVLQSSFDDFKKNTPPDLNYKRFVELIKDFFYFFPKYPKISAKLVTNAILEQYSNQSSLNISADLINNLDFATGDYSYLCPMIRLIDFYADNGLKVYQYYFTHKSSKPTHSAWLGVIHGDQMPFILGLPLDSSKNYSNTDKILSRKLVNYWSSFVKYDDPNVENNNEYWPVYTSQNIKSNMTSNMYINLRSPIEIGAKLKSEYCFFWNSYVRNLVIKSDLSNFYFSN